jgi:hypothetical protein
MRNAPCTYDASFVDYLWTHLMTVRNVESIPVWNIRTREGGVSRRRAAYLYTRQVYVNST